MLGSGVATPRVPIVMILPHPRRAHRGDQRAGAADRRQDIASERRDPVLAGGLGEAMLDKRAGIGDQNVDRAVRQRSGAEQFGLPGDGEIAEQNLCIAAGPLDPLSLRRGRLATASMHDHLTALQRQLLNNRRAHTPLLPVTRAGRPESSRSIAEVIPTSTAAPVSDPLSRRSPASIRPAEVAVR